MMQQLNFGPRASMGASLYENEFVKENGVWKFSIDHTFNTWTAGYDGGWARSPGRGVPGPSKTYPPDTPPTFTFQMFPTVYEIPFHYPHPVTGAATSTRLPNPAATSNAAMTHRSRRRSAACRRRSRPSCARSARASRRKRPASSMRRCSRRSRTRGSTVTRDLAYGPHERNVLDVFTAPGTRPAAANPSSCSCTAAASRAARSAREGTPFYDNIGLWAVGHGLVGVTLNYRLAPQSTWPSGIEDLTAAVAWLKANIARYGGDPSKIVLWGHSAGAAHVADYVANAAKRKARRRRRGRDPDVGLLRSRQRSVGVEGLLRRGRRRPMRSARRCRGSSQTDVPLLVNDAELDPDMFQTETDKLVAARAAAGKPVERVHLAGHSHISETYAVGTGDRSLSGPVLEFVRRVSGSHAQIAVGRRAQAASRTSNYVAQEKGAGDCSPAPEVRRRWVARERHPP